MQPWAGPSLQIGKAAPLSHMPPQASLIDTTRRLHHPHCVVCGSQHPLGLRIVYEIRPNGGVSATVDCPSQWEGYPGVVHGGVIASLLDGAMTNCLFAEGIAAYTADLHVRYRRPLKLNTSARVAAVITRRIPPMFVVKSWVEQNDQVRAVGTGKFMAEDKAFQKLWKR